VRFLITGVTGFAGGHLAQLLAAHGHAVFGMTRGTPAPHSPLPAEHLLSVDWSDTTSLAAVLRQVRPDGVFHLAAQTSVRESFAAAHDTYHANLFGSLRLFEAVLHATPKCRVLFVGSGDVYGGIDAASLPVTESARLLPLSPYAVSKLAADLAAYQWWRTNGLDVVRVRPFNHTGPGQSPRFICSSFAQQIVDIELGRRAPRIGAGNLEVVRDFSDVRDVVRAYLAAWETGASGEVYNLCAGVGRTPRSIAETLMSLSGVRAALESDPARERSFEAAAMVGDSTKLREATAWSPLIPWEQTLRDLLVYWRESRQANPTSSADT
jgi:GDP-4-dehydro-6-deoxy-D-mannose reductase